MTLNCETCGDSEVKCYECLRVIEDAEIEAQNLVNFMGIWKTKEKKEELV
jgi:hypothetical protein